MNETSTILAIDPGNEQSAYVALQPERQQLVSFDKLPNMDLLDMLEEDLSGEACLFGARIDVLVIERVACYGMRVGREIFEACEWLGDFRNAWRRSGNEAQYLYRPEVKLHLCGRRNATDADVRAKLIDLFGPGKAKAIGLKASPGPLYGVKSDCWAALAVAVTWADRARVAVGVSQ